MPAHLFRPASLFIATLAMLSGASPTLAAGPAPRGAQAPAPYAAKKNFWTLGILTGPSPFQLSTPPGIQNPVLTAAQVTDLNVDTLAHPFIVPTGSAYYLFFTAKDLKTDKGGIGMAESADGLHWKFRRTVVHEPFVLSHPCVFKWRDQYYMVPEAHTETAVRLYRATHFPDQWQYERNLIEGDHFISPTLFRYKDMWWMFTARSGNDNLRLFYASDLRGPWTEHPRSPLVKKDLRTARPAGTPFVFDGKLYRLAQDCVPTYGYQVRAFQITELTPTAYADKLIEKPLVKASGSGWNTDAMHHVDARQIAKGKWIAAVDALGELPPR